MLARRTTAAVCLLTAAGRLLPPGLLSTRLSVVDWLRPCPLDRPAMILFTMPLLVLLCRLIGIFPRPSMSAAFEEAMRNETNDGCSIASSSSIMQTYFANDSCDPFSAESSPCLMGNYVEYAVNVSSANDVIAAINFAKKNNIRFVIRNTGHE
jgi:hypothetical protein